MWTTKIFAALGLFICMIGVIETRLRTDVTNHQINEDGAGTTFVSLNEDCVFGIMNYLDLGDLDNLAEASSRFVSAARYMFNKEITKLINVWTDRVINESISNTNYNPFQTNLTGTARKIVEPLVLKNRFLNDAKIIFLFKFVILGEKFRHFPWNYVYAAKSFVKSPMNGTNSIEEYASLLTVSDHWMILSILENKDESGMQWVKFAYMMILEKSKAHLKNQFTLPMMNIMSKVRNAANALHLVGTTSTDSEFKYVERFELDWDFYKGEITSEAAKGEFHLPLVKAEIKLLYRTMQPFPEESKLQQYATIYCAIKSLPSANFIELVESSHLNLAFFDLESNKNMIKKLRDSLKTELRGSRVLETGFEEQASVLERWIGENATAGLRLMMERSYNAPPLKLKILRKIEGGVKRLTDAKDFSDYIELLRKSVKLVPYYYIPIRLDVTMASLYHAYFTFAHRPGIFDDSRQLAEVDRLHSELVDMMASSLTTQKQTIVGYPQFGALLNATFENFDSLFPPREDDAPSTRLKQRIAANFLIVLADGAFNRFYPYPEGNNAFRYRSKIITIFHSLVHRLDGVALSQYSRGPLLGDWIEFNKNLNEEAQLFYTRNDVEEFQFMYQPYKTSGDVYKDTFAYFCHLNVARFFKKFNMTQPDQILENILALEESIGNADTIDENLQNEVLASKFAFYESFSDEVKEKQEKGNLNKFVESKIDLVLSQHNENTKNVEIAILKSIYNAVVDNNDTAKEQLGGDMIRKLSELSLNRRYSNKDFNTIQEDYEACKQVLKF